MWQAVLLADTQSYFDALRSPTAVRILNRKRPIYAIRVVQFTLHSSEKNLVMCFALNYSLSFRLSVGNIETTNRV